MKIRRRSLHVEQQRPKHVAHHAIFPRRESSISPAFAELP
jgi:hypothetical protein